MKITDLRATPVNIPFTAPYRFSYGSIASLTKTIVEVETDDGVTGLGEVADGDRVRRCAAAARALIGLDIRDITHRRAPLRAGHALHALGRLRWRSAARSAASRWRCGTRAAAPRACRCRCCWAAPCASEIALTEYFSYRLPGADPIPANRRPSRSPAIARRMIEQHDSDSFEGKVGTVSLDDEVTMVREVRAAIGDRMLRLDANGGWTVPTAREAFRRLDPYVIHYYEDPVGDL